MRNPKKNSKTLTLVVTAAAGCLLLAACSGNKGSEASPASAVPTNLTGINSTTGPPQLDNLQTVEKATKSTLKVALAKTPDAPATAAGAYKVVAAFYGEVTSKQPSLKVDIVPGAMPSLKVTSHNVDGACVVTFKSNSNKLDTNVTCS